MRGIITENTSCNVTHDIIIEGQVAFKAGETVVVEIVSPNLQRPEYKYVVTSKSLQRKFQLSDRDLSEVLDQETPAQLRVPEREFLNIISKRSISKINADFWSNHVGVLSEEVSRLIHLGLIEVAGTREKAEAGYTQKELKLLSEERGLKVSGKKGDLVDRLLESMTEAESECLVSGIDFYILTPEGQRVVRGHFQEKERAKSEAEEVALAYLAERNYEKAADAIAAYKRKYSHMHWTGIDSTSSADGVLSITNKKTEMISYLLDNDYLDLDLSEEDRKKVACTLALGAMANYEISDRAKLLLKVTGGTLPCPDLIRFLSEEPCGGYALSMNPEKPKDLAEIYVHTKMFETDNRRELEEVLECTWTQGVKIRVCEEEGTNPKIYSYCPLCEGGKREFKKSEKDQIPKLPRHWGCRCQYAQWARPDTYISKKAYAKLKKGMTYEQVVDIVGGESNISYEDRNMVIYIWDGEALGGSAQLGFIDGKLHEKGQAGLA